MCWVRYISDAPILIVSAIFLLLTVSSPVYSSDQDFPLVNATGVTIDELYLSPVSVKDWQEDVLGVEVLEDGEEAKSGRRSNN